MIRSSRAYLRTSQPLRYVVIGGISYVVEIATLLSLANLFSLSPEASVAYSFWVGLVTSFLLQKHVAFKSKANDRRAIGRQSVLYGALVLFNYLFTIVFVGAFTGILGLVAARTIALLLTVAWNYFVYKKIFK